MFDRLTNVFLCLFVILLSLEILQVSVAGLDIRLHQFALAGLIAWFIGRDIYLRRTGSQTPPILSLSSPEIYYLILPVLLLVLGLIGGLLHTALQPTITQTLSFVTMLLTFAVFLYTVRCRNRLHTVFVGLFWGTIIHILVALYQAVAFKVGLPAFMVFEGRVNGLLPEPNWLAIWTAVVIALLLPLTFFSAHWFSSRWNSWWWVLFFFSVMVTILSLTRASWLALVITGIVFYIALLWPAKYRVKTVFSHLGKTVGLTILALVCIELLALSPFSLSERAMSIITQSTTHYETTDGESISKEEAQKRDEEEVVERKVKDVNVVSRIEDYKTALRTANEHPTFGIGFAGYKERVGETRNTSSIFLGVLVAAGIPGLAVYVLIHYTHLRTAVWFMREKYYFLASIVINMSLVIIITGMFNNGLLMGFIWMVLGVLSALTIWGTEIVRQSTDE